LGLKERVHSSSVGEAEVAGVGYSLGEQFRVENTRAREALMKFHHVLLCT
jgi:hypothetical protein